MPIATTNTLCLAALCLLQPFETEGFRSLVPSSSQASSSSVKMAEVAHESLSDRLVGDGNYVLGGDPKQSSGKSFIYEAIPSKDGQPIPGAEPVIVKLSKNTEALEREAKNYETIVTGGDNASNTANQEDLFVKVHDYIEQADPSCDRLKHKAALVMEKGSQDLKTFLEENGPMKGSALRAAAWSTAKAVEAVHSSNMVWTEIKSANFVVTKSNDIKGIDLESAIPQSNNPIDFSPEACPPEFALAFLCGREPSMEMEPTFDIWSLGMLFYEMATGIAYFDTTLKDGVAISTILKNAAMDKAVKEGTAGVDLNKHVKIDAVVDPEMIKLIAWCLTIEPAARPTVQQVLQHPYFAGMQH